MRKKLIQVVAGVAAVAAASVGLITASASALPPGSPSDGSVTVSPSTGINTTSITLTPPAGAACQGDSATGGYRWQAYIASASVDIGTLTYTASGPSAVSGAVTAPLLSSGGTPVVNQTTSVGTALITGVPTFSFNAFPAGFFPNGAYNIGFACTLSGATTRFWAAPITITNPGAVLNYAFGAVPAAPVLASPLTVGNGTLSGTFTEAAATPAVTGFTVTAQPQPSGTPVTQTLAAGATSFSLTGLTNGTAYAVSLIATNSAGNSPASNSVNGTPAVAAQPPVTNLQAAPGAAGSAVLTWTAPAGSAIPTGYTVDVTPTVAGAPFTAPGSPYTVSGLAAGTSYSFTVTATYVAPDSGTPASVTFFATGAQVIIQDVTAVRPVGALILTQRCGVNGALAAVPASTVPGFDSGLPAVSASTDQVGTAPTTGAAAGGSADPEFPNYPFPSPASYPTHCGLSLGTGSFVTSGSLAGQYYAASGKINQVTVADNRDGTAPWTVNATMSTFANGSSTFDGDHLGWIPSVTSTTPGQTVAAGSAVNPLTVGGLGNGEVLASAPTGAAQGIAKLDARVLLLIPVANAAGTYTGTLTFSAI